MRRAAALGATLVGLLAALLLLSMRGSKSVKRGGRQVRTQDPSGASGDDPGAHPTELTSQELEDALRDLEESVEQERHGPAKREPAATAAPTAPATAPPATPPPTQPQQQQTAVARSRFAAAAPAPMPAPDELRVCTEIDTPDGQAVMRCVEPDLQVKDPTNVFVLFKTERGGGRFFYLLLEGIRHHPAIHLVGGPPYFCSDPEFAHFTRMLKDRFGWQCRQDTVEALKRGAPSGTDVALCFFPPTQPIQWHRDRLAAYIPGFIRTVDGEPCRTHRCDMPLALRSIENTSAESNLPEGGLHYPFPVPRDRMVFVDEGDGSGPHPAVPPGRYLAYYKRSWTGKYPGRPPRHRGMPREASASYMPIPYAVGDSYLPNTIAAPRSLDVVCTLRKDLGHDRRNPAIRARVLKWLREAQTEWKVPPGKWAIGQATGASRTTISQGYFEVMRRARIIVTANPSGWEIDYRLCEALSSGALVFVDQMWGPFPHQPEDGRHIIYYDGNDRGDLLAKLEYWLARPRQARRVAVAGYLHALKHLRGVSLADYIIRSLPNSKKQYNHTGRELIDTLTPREGPMARLVPDGHMKYRCKPGSCSYGPLYD
eukprot:TRINITY_DN659_c0_g1_i1.p1 TRINITY_DN659_c0_g1~~TRINITY_DN659_c0_g1_i1.p1  ORF type:complete len:597 (+),score=56.71 TRINITY_DN659_c0_g1_i1:79-1869(+)